MRRYEMENFYEIATIALGVWVLVLHKAKNKHRRMVFKLTTCIDQIAHRKWQAFETDDGFEVVDSSDGEVMLGVRDAAKRK
jgi:hypothetical protein